MINLPKNLSAEQLVSIEMAKPVLKQFEKDLKKYLKVASPTPELTNSIIEQLKLMHNMKSGIFNRDHIVEEYATESDMLTKG